MQNHVARWQQTCWLPDVWQDSAETPEKEKEKTVNSFCYKLCWVTCFLGIFRKRFRRERDWRSASHWSDSNPSIMGKEKAASADTENFPKSVINTVEVGAVGSAQTHTYCYPTVQLNKPAHQSNEIGISSGAVHIPRNIPSVYQSQIKSDLSQNIAWLRLSVLPALLFHVLILDSHYSWWKSSKKN